MSSKTTKRKIRPKKFDFIAAGLTRVNVDGQISHIPNRQPYGDDTLELVNPDLKIFTYLGVWVSGYRATIQTELGPTTNEFLTFRLPKDWVLCNEKDDRRQGTIVARQLNSDRFIYTTGRGSHCCG